MLTPPNPWVALPPPTSSLPIHVAPQKQKQTDQSDQTGVRLLCRQCCCITCASSLARVPNITGAVFKITDPSSGLITLASQRFRKFWERLERYSGWLKNRDQRNKRSHSVLDEILHNKQCFRLIQQVTRRKQRLFLSRESLILPRPETTSEAVLGIHF